MMIVLDPHTRKTNVWVPAAISKTFVTATLARPEGAWKLPHPHIWNCAVVLGTSCGLRPTKFSVKVVQLLLAGNSQEPTGSTVCSGGFRFRL